MIGKPQIPRCFKYKTSHTYYMNQDNAWVDELRFRRWINNFNCRLIHFIPKIQQKTKKPITLLCDNAPGHLQLDSSRYNVTLWFFPPRVTCVHQPMDQGIIAAAKKIYKSLLVEKLAIALPRLETLKK